jgi:hypothetical protein
VLDLCPAKWKQISKSLIYMCFYGHMFVQSNKTYQSP